jgi:hypothetical protein
MQVQARAYPQTGTGIGSPDATQPDLSCNTSGYRIRPKADLQAIRQQCPQLMSYSPRKSDFALRSGSYKLVFFFFFNS